MTNKLNILLVYTGGTIGMIKDYKTNALKAFNLNYVIDKIPELKQLNCNIDSISLEEPIDSSNMNTRYYVEVVEIIEKNYTKYSGFVVLTGSDTMSYISSTISFMLKNLKKPIIFTGSQLPIGDLRTDAKENLITSIQIAASQKNGNPIISEVCLYFEYKLYRANRTTKVSTEQFEAFTSKNYLPLVESGVKLKFNENLIYKPKENNNKLIVQKKLIDNVIVIKIFPGIKEQFIAQILSIPNLKGVVLETFGSGNAPTKIGFINILKKAIKSGIKIVNVTQCISGSIIQGAYNTNIKLEKIGVINGKDITTEAAIGKLMVLLDRNLDQVKFKFLFEKPMRGEITNI